MLIGSPMGDAERQQCDYVRSVQALACAEMAGEFVNRAITASDDTARTFWVAMARGARRHMLSLVRD